MHTNDLNYCMVHTLCNGLEIFSNVSKTHSKGHQTWVKVATAPIVSVKVTDVSVVSINAFDNLTTV